MLLVDDSDELVHHILEVVLSLDEFDFEEFLLYFLEGFCEGVGGLEFLEEGADLGLAEVVVAGEEVILGVVGFGGRHGVVVLVAVVGLVLLGVDLEDLLEFVGDEGGLGLLGVVVEPGVLDEAGVGGLELLEVAA